MLRGYMHGLQTGSYVAFGNYTIVMQGTCTDTLLYSVNYDPLRMLSLYLNLYIAYYTQCFEFAFLLCLKIATHAGRI